MMSLHVVSRDHCLAPNLNAVGGGGGVATGTGCNLIGQCVGVHVAPAGKECSKTQAIPPFFLKETDLD